MLVVLRQWPYHRGHGHEAVDMQTGISAVRYSMKTVGCSSHRARWHTRAQSRKLFFEHRCRRRCARKSHSNVGRIPRAITFAKISSKRQLDDVGFNMKAERHSCVGFICTAPMASGQKIEFIQSDAQYTSHAHFLGRPEYSAFFENLSPLEHSIFNTCEPSSSSPSTAHGRTPGIVGLVPDIAFDPHATCLGGG